MDNKEQINDNIKVIHDSLIFSEYQAEIYRNHTNNKISYIVIHNDYDDCEYISCILLNINIFDYYDGWRYKNNFSMDYLDEFDMFHYNGFLGVQYYQDEYITKQKINDFFIEYGKYFIKRYNPYSKPIITELKDDVLQLYDEIYKQIKLRNKLNQLFWG